MTFPHSLSAQLTDLLGERYTEGRSDRDNHAGTEAHHDAMPPDAVAYPVNTEEVAAILRACRNARVPVIAHGAGSSLEGNASAPQGGLCLDMTRMDRIVAVRPEDMDCTVEAGVTREALNTHLRDTGLFFPVDPGANATLGGMAATRASGTNAVHYGTMRENVLSLTVVTAEGEIIRTARRARKSSAGYDLTHLYLGSEGTLGIITEISLRLYGRPEATMAAVCTFPDAGSASTTAVEAIQMGLTPARMEYLDAGCIRAVNAYSAREDTEADTLFVEFIGSPEGLREQVALFEELAAANGGKDFRWAKEEEARNRLWRARHTAYTATVAQRPGARGWATDVCVPLSALPACIDHAKALLDDCPVPASIMGHVGDGNFHVVFALDPEATEERALLAELNARMVAEALSHDGTCTGEHGVGLGKQKYMADEHGPALDIMRRVKAALDPDNLMNPGKVLPLAQEARR
ncbi:FAD-binding oxidoreductase [Alloyangia pacifica]|uniref:D-lactate dehydrogenase (cytochrome) n=1 Tax=Alloyangia pacifica TaxID=311180 RepID=A0A1I6WED3_9RHOB|nr:FAD-linked oxidase C-terminal domain-containing protein [Alloyangia pacifica]SDI59845.1 D-lactate dehydrogenase (cytochrome) [Alloyangia pacifica]SFT23924.1 D-lactate dehydrogenase (cytochrome) [Alloyangia pacifica]